MTWMKSTKNGGAIELNLICLTSFSMKTASHAWMYV